MFNQPSRSSMKAQKEEVHTSLISAPHLSRPLSRAGCVSIRLRCRDMNTEGTETGCRYANTLQKKAPLTGNGSSVLSQVPVLVCYRDVLRRFGVPKAIEDLQPRFVSCVGARALDCTEHSSHPEKTTVASETC